MIVCPENFCVKVAVKVEMVDLSYDQKHQAREQHKTHYFASQQILITLAAIFVKPSPTT